MKIFHYVESYLSITETFIYNYIILCAARFDEVYIITKRTANLDMFPLPANVRIIHISFPYKSRKTLAGNYSYLRGRLYLYPGKYAGLRKLMLANKKSLVHCHFGNMGAEWLKIADYLRVKNKIAVSFYGYDTGELVKTNPSYAGSLKNIWKRCAAVFCEGPFMFKKLERLGLPAKKEYLNPIIIDTDKYPKKNISVLRVNLIKFLIIGRFVEKKGIHITLTALGKLKAAGFTDFSVSIVGSGPMKSDYDTIVSAYNLHDNVSFKGLIPLSECKNMMLDHDVFIHPSLESKTGDSEGGAPTIIIEAQYIGIPVISSFHADIPYVMGYDDFLCKENDTEDLIRVVKKFIEIPPDKLKGLIEKGRDHVLKQHSYFHNSYIGTIKKLSA